MAELEKYTHLERFGTSAVEGIEVGETHVFPKLDGTNGSIWFEDGQVQAGSRNRVLHLGSDNVGFLAYIMSKDPKAEKLRQMAEANPHLIFYGEWLVPHTIKNYRDDAWRRFYIFDVLLRGTGEYIPYGHYQALLVEYGVDYLSPIRVFKNAGYEDYVKVLEQNTYLMKDGAGFGEGVVIKNYGWVNRFGYKPFAKLISNAFKEDHYKEMGAPVIGPDVVEEKIVLEFVTKHLVDKVVAKFAIDGQPFDKKKIPGILNTVFYDLVTEELWEAIKKHKNPKIDFGLLNRLTLDRVKTLLPEVFGVRGGING